MVQNQLAQESSAYLKQHSENPVHWLPYGQHALELAQKENKPIFLSIGYSSCHWCHVMADESFADQQTADILNESFINIKVDREEWPDIDQYYQKACMAFTGRGGWPLSVFLTADMKPFYIGTYFPKIARDNLPSFMQILLKILQTLEQDPEAIKTNVEKMHEAIIHEPQLEKNISFEGHFPAPANIIGALKNYQDNEFGGYGEAPKFPHFAFLEWACEHITEGMIPKELGQHIVKSVEALCMGGIYDQAKGGFHRYSTDARYLVPHFEKMLYDQSGFLKVLIKTSMFYPSPLVFDCLLQTLDYLNTEMLSEAGYFYSAQDADSEGHEGLYFIFSEQEFDEAIDQFDQELSAELPLLKKWFGISSSGNFEKSQNVIALIKDYKEEFLNPKNWEKIRKVKAALLKARRTRIPPVTDNKGIASWNFLMISALCDVYQYAKIKAVKDSAMALLNKCLDGIHREFLVETEEITNSGRRYIIRHTNTKERTLPYFEDYVFFAEAQIRLYEITASDSFKNNGIDAIRFIFKEFFKEQKFWTRSLLYNESEPYQNLPSHSNDQSHKSALATLIGLVRRLNPIVEDQTWSQQCSELIDQLKQFCLANPIAFGESLRSVTYPANVYRKLQVPANWIKNPEYLGLIAHFSARFVLDYHQKNDETWQICNINSCEKQGSGWTDFKQVFELPNQES